MIQVSKISYDKLKSDSIFLIGSRSTKTGRIIWDNLHETTGDIDEGDLRWLIQYISFHISKGRINPGAARKFLDGKLIYQVIPNQSDSTNESIFCLYTEFQNIRKPVKLAFNTVINRHGVYSAKRLFNEFLDLIENQEKLQSYEISIEEALRRINSDELQNMSVNELGYLISLIHTSTEFTQDFLEKVYLIIYEYMQELVDGQNPEGGINSDLDEFLDAAFIIAKLYEKPTTFHLALELNKSIIPMAAKNDRNTLEVACNIRISAIYKEYFKNIELQIISTLTKVNLDHLSRMDRSNRELYYCLLGDSYNTLENYVDAQKAYNNAIAQAESSQGSVNSELLAEAYSFLGQNSEKSYLLKDAARYYHTAAALMFSVGDIRTADKYQEEASHSEIRTGLSMLHNALLLHMDENRDHAEFIAWEGIRLMLKSIFKARPNRLSLYTNICDEILVMSNHILIFPGRIRRHKKTLTMIRKFVQSMNPDNFANLIQDEAHKQQLISLVDRFIPIPAPIIMLLTTDGRLIKMGKIEEDGWENPEIQGVLLSGVLSAIMMMIGEVGDSQTALKTVDAGSLTIMIEQKDGVVVSLLVDRDLPILRKRLEETLKFIIKKYRDILDDWDGSTAEFDEFRFYAEKIFSPSSLTLDVVY